MHSLRMKFSLLLFGLLSGACLALAWTAARHEAGALEAEIERRTAALVVGLARGAAPALRDGGGEELAGLLRLVGAQQGVVAARVLTRDGRVVATLHGDEYEKHFDVLAPVAVTEGASPKLRRVGSRLTGTMGILDGGAGRGRPLGEAQLEVDVAFVTGPVLREASQRLALVAGLVLALALAAGWSFVSLLVGPLARLRRGVDRLAAGDLTVRVPRTTRDEVGELTRAFNAMGEALVQQARVQDAFGRYASDYVLGQLLQAPEGDALAGAERDVTIVFVDIRRFTRLSEGLKARAVVAVLNETFQLVTERIHAHGGTIDKFIGDSVMAYFGAPVPQTDHALRAVAASVDVVRALADRNRALRSQPEGASQSVPIEVGIGIHTGIVVVGNIGSERRADFTAIGDAVNVAHRIDKLAGPGQILVSEAVQRRVRGAFRLRFQGERQLDGRVEPVHLYCVERDADT